MSISETAANITVWFDEEASGAWNALPPAAAQWQRRFSDIAIEAALTIRMVIWLVHPSAIGSVYRYLEE